MAKNIKILVLSCNTGEGHNSAGQAIFEELIERGIYCEFVDSLAFASSAVSKKISDSYSFLTTKASGMFNLLYKTGEFVSRVNGLNHKSPVYYINQLYAAKMRDYIISNHFDVVILPHLFPAEVITGLKNKDFISVKTVAIATDYTCIPFWEETNPDYFIIPHKDLVLEFFKKGIPLNKILPIGIPVKKEFRESIFKKEARIKLYLDVEKPLYLIMTGSMGFGNLDILIRGLLKKCGNKINIVVLCGKNKKLRNNLIKKFHGYSNIFFKEFTDKVSLYMDACDVIFTKPGGLTSTEAAVKNIPLIHTNPIPGCETMNANFFFERGMSYVNSSIDAQIDIAGKLCSNEFLRNKMIHSQCENVNKKACSIICNWIISFAEQSNVLKNK